MTPDRLRSSHPLESLKTSSDRNINVAAVSYLFQLMHIQCPPSSLRFMSDCAGVCFSTILDNSMLNWCYQEESLSLSFYLSLFQCSYLYLSFLCPSFSLSLSFFISSTPNLHVGQKLLRKLRSVPGGLPWKHLTSSLVTPQQRGKNLYFGSRLGAILRIIF